MNNDTVVTINGYNCQPMSGGYWSVSKDHKVIASWVTKEQVRVITNHKPIDKPSVALVKEAILWENCFAMELLEEPCASEYCSFVALDAYCDSRDLTFDEGSTEILAAARKTYKE